MTIGCGSGADIYIRENYVCGRVDSLFEAADAGDILAHSRISNTCIEVVINLCSYIHVMLIVIGSLFVTLHCMNLLNVMNCVYLNFVIMCFKPTHTEIPMYLSALACSTFIEH